MDERAVIIVGSGPAGISTALSIQRAAPHLAGNLLVLEKARHPRPKLCGGGLTALAEQTLRDLGLALAVPSYPVHVVRFLLAERPLDFSARNLMRVVRRDEFDAHLVAQARARGIEVREDEPVKLLERAGGQIRVLTPKQEYRALVVVGADGANSVVRKTFFKHETSRVSRLMEIVVPADGQSAPEFEQHMAVFDFRPMVRNRLQGYVWDFPSLIEGRKFLNCGVFDSRVRGGPRADLAAILRQHLQQRNLAVEEEIRLQAHPERWFEPSGTYGVPHVLLVGDAAGIEPWLGEGISLALAYGPVAASEIRRAFDRNDFSFASYTRTIMQHRLGKLMNRNRRIALCFYSRSLLPATRLFARALHVYFQRKYGTPS